MIYDYIIIGCGIGGLYTGYKLNKLNFNVLSLEASIDLGGRALERKFINYNVKLGGGIVDIDNIQLLSLLNEFNIKYYKSKQKIIDCYLPYNFNINESIKKIKDKYFNINKCLNMTVDEFLTLYFDDNFKKLYYKYTEFNDYKNQDINDYIFRYKIDDDIREEYEFYYFNYNELINKLKTNIIHEKVISVYRLKNNNLIINNKYITRNIINCLTILDAKQLYSYKFLDEIGSVPFCRIYTYHSQNINIENNIILLDNECKKIIKINDNILMAVYCDSDNALYWRNKSNNNKIIKTLYKKLPFIPHIDDYLYIFWNSGVHYFKPNPCNTDNIMMRKKWLLKNMNPEKGIYFAGEYFSENNGYVEGAISSVNYLFKNFINK